MSRTPFGFLPREVSRKLEKMSYELLYPSGTMLFGEGDPARGVYAVASGRIKLSIGAGNGKTLILRLAEPGDVIGLPATLSGSTYEVSAHAIGPCRVSFVKRDAFLQFMATHREVSLAVCEQLRKIYSSACFEIRRIGLSHSAGEKLAKLLVEWPASNGERPDRIRFVFSHEEVGQMIGSSRETVSRAFATLKKKGLAEVKGSVLHIHDRTALQEIASGLDVLAIRPPDKHSSTPAQASKDADPRDFFHPDGV